MTTNGRELADALRTWRRRARAPESGGGVRRVPGLRREELAERAGISVEYIVRLEQGRSLRPSSQVVSALARALELAPAERNSLFSAAGLIPPRAPLLPRRVGAATRRLVERTTETPIAIFSRAWDLLLANDLWIAVFGSIRETAPHATNLAWQHVVARYRPIVRSESDDERYARQLIWDVKREAARHPDDARLADLQRQLERQLGPNPGPLEDRPAEERVKTVRHPLVGPISLTFDMLLSPEDDTWVTIYTALPASVDARKLETLRRDAPARDATAV